MRKNKKNITEYIINNTKEYIKNHKLDLNNKNIGIGYSAGVDSSVLFYVMNKIKKEYNFNIFLMHVNYNLRGEDAIKDRELAKKQAKNNDTKIFVKEIDNTTYGEGINLQLKAREDRYIFYKEIRKKEKLDYILLAHHKDDLLETIIYKMCRGAGSSISISMKEKFKHILRPLIYSYKNEIIQFAEENNVEYRNDITNSKNLYRRNKIRNQIVPVMTEINSNAKDNIINFTKKVYDETKYLRKKISICYKNVIENKSTLKIDLIKKYNKTIQNKVLIKFLIKNNIEATAKRIIEIKKIINSDKPNISSTFDNKLIIKEYSILKITEKNNEKNISDIIIENDGNYSFNKILITAKIIEIKKEIIDLKDKNKIYINSEYPINIRKRKDGDFLISHPDGTKKSIRKILINSKVPIKMRDDIPIVEKNNEIIAVFMNDFSDNKINNNYTVKSETEKCICLDFQILHK